MNGRANLCVGLGHPPHSLFQQNFNAFQGVELEPEPGTHNHNSDLRDSYSHEYIQKQVWGEQIFTRYQSSRRFDLVKTRLTDR